MISFIQNLKSKGLINPAQAALLNKIYSGQIFSLYAEIRAVLYLGVLFFLAGLGAVLKRYYLDLGHVAILSALGISIVSAFVYCFRRGLPYDPGIIESPNLAFDYVLYLGCVLFAIAAAYIETHFHLLGEWWDAYLLVSSILAGFLAYRFDNRLVLVLSLSTLASWFGLRLKSWSVLDLKVPAIIYSVLVGAAGWGLASLKIKPHFLNVYMSLSAHIFCLASLSGIMNLDTLFLYLLLLAVATGFLILWGMNSKKFSFFAIGVFYSYLGITAAVFKLVSLGTFGSCLYILLTSISVVILLTKFRRWLREES